MAASTSRSGAHRAWSARKCARFIATSPPTRRVHPRRTQSTDAFLRFATGIPVSSEDLLSRFNVMPASGLIAIFYNTRDPRSPLLAMTVAYLAWSHPQPNSRRMSAIVLVEGYVNSISRSKPRFLGFVAQI